jgi:hypothetical protein
MVWKDQLLPGASRISLPDDGSLLPGWVRDTFGAPQERNDWVMGPQGVPVISGSNEAQPGYTGPAPGHTAGLYAALSAQQGQAAQARAFADSNLAQLHQSILASQGPTIGGHDIESASAFPFLQALGQMPKFETEADRLAREAKERGLGANIPV